MVQQCSRGWTRSRTNFPCRDKRPAPVLLAALLTLAAPQALTLAQAFERAVGANPEIASARLSVRVAEAGVEAAGQLPNPGVALSVGPDEPKIFGAVDLKLPILGQRGTALAAAEREVPIARGEVTTQELKVRGAVRRAYYALAVAQQQAALFAQTAANAQALEKMTQDKFQTGSAPRLEVEQAAIARRQAAQDLVDKEAAVRTAQVDLSRLLGVEDELLASDALFPIPAAPPADELLARVARHPEVQTLRRQQDAALARAQRERAAIRPVPDVSVEVERLSNVTAQGATEMYYGLRFGLSFELPVLSWNGGRVHAEVAQASVQAAQAQAAERRLRGEIRAARSRWEAAGSRARVYVEELVPAAVRIEEMARAGYQLGRAPLFSVLQAQAEVTLSRSRGVDAAGEAQKAFADLEEAAGDIP